MGNRVSRALEREKCVDFRMAPQGRLQARQLLDRPASNSGSPEFDNFEPGRFYARVIVPRPHRPGGVQRACSCSLAKQGSGALLKRRNSDSVWRFGKRPARRSVLPTRHSYLPSTLRFTKRIRALAANTPAARTALRQAQGKMRADDPSGTVPPRGFPEPAPRSRPPFPRSAGRDAVPR